MPATSKLGGIARLGRDGRVHGSDHDYGKVVRFIEVNGALIGTVVWHTPLHFLSISDWCPDMSEMTFSAPPGDAHADLAGRLSGNQEAGSRSP